MGLGLVSTLAIACSASGGATPPAPDVVVADTPAPAPDSPSVDGGSGVDTAAPPVSCAVPQTACPDTHPHPGQACEGELSCEYIDENEIDIWTYTCSGTYWTAQVECRADGGCAAPPLSETCKPHFEGTVEGASLQVGPQALGEPFRPFGDGEQVELIWGPQGSPMLEFRLHLDGADELECVALRSSLTLGGETVELASMRVRVRCGETLRVYAIVPFDVACDEIMFDLELNVSVDGVGPASAKLRFMGGAGCFG